MAQLATSHFPTALWASATIGWTGLDRVIAGDTRGGCLKLLLFLLLAPFAPIFVAFLALADALSLAGRQQFLTGPRLRWPSRRSFRNDRMWAILVMCCLTLLLIYLHVRRWADSSVQSV